MQSSFFNPPAHQVDVAGRELPIYPTFRQALFARHIDAFHWTQLINYLVYALIIWLGARFNARSSWLKLLSGGANVIFTTCDVDLAAPVVQEAINRGVLAIAPCIGTDQMGPKRFGAKGKLAFSFGNVAQDEGSAMAQYAWGKGWRTAENIDRPAFTSAGDSCMALIKSSMMS